MTPIPMAVAMWLLPLWKNCYKGKTHQAVATAMEAIGQGLPVYFVSLAQLISDLRKAYEENQLESD
jgi:ATP:corrinoid adenosyltransferase